MTTFTKSRTDFFYPVLAAVAISAPMLLVVATGMLPEGRERGEIVVAGFGLVLAMLGVALILRAAYALGFTKAIKIGAGTRKTSRAFPASHACTDDREGASAATSLTA